jgi:hypothetical protein
MSYYKNDAEEANKRLREEANARVNIGPLKEINKNLEDIKKVLLAIFKLLETSGNGKD